MCELGSQGGLDGRWHCSAAQVETLLFKHASYRFTTLCISSVNIYLSVCQHVLLLDFKKLVRDGASGRFYESAVGCKLILFSCALRNRWIDTPN